jgi:hypothetical protein
VTAAVAVAAALFVGAPMLLAQAPAEVIYKDDFQSYGTQANPAGWVDTAIGNPSPVADGQYKTWPDPTQGNKAPNVVYGSKSGSGKPEGRNPRIGTFSTLTTHAFDAKGRFEFSGRLIRTRDDARLGVTFLSQYPSADKYYLLGLWSQPASSKLTMQLFAFDKSLEDPANPLGDQSARLVGVKDSGLSLTRNVWYRFLIRVDDTEGRTKISAKIWENGAAEPEAFQIAAEDASEARLTSGHIGLWSAVKGEAYIDEILAKSPVNPTATTIAFYHLNTDGEEVSLADGHESRHPVTPVIRVTPDGPYTATLDGEPFTSGTTVETEGTHAVDVAAAGTSGTVTARVSF